MVFLYLCGSLHSSKFLENSAKQIEAAKTEKEIDEARENYRTVAYRASVLFFGIVELANLNAMYQFSLQYFQNLFSMVIY